MTAARYCRRCGYELFDNGFDPPTDVAWDEAVCLPEEPWAPEYPKPWLTPGHSLKLIHDSYDGGPGANNLAMLLSDASIREQALIYPQHVPIEVHGPPFGEVPQHLRHLP